MGWCALETLGCSSSSGNPGTATASTPARDAAAATGSSSGVSGSSSGVSGDDGPVGVFDPGDASTVADDASIVTLPTNFVPTQFGGYALGAPIQGDGADAGVSENTTSASCNLVVGVVRDFKDAPDDNDTGHPDFDTFMGDARPTTGLVNAMLGADLKPVFANHCAATTTNATCINGQQMTTQANFDQWYRFTANVNKPFLVYLQFVPNGSVFTFQSDEYFPLDDAGWGNNALGDDNKMHNFGFTTELHLEFTYKGGEQFTFIGDDDVWVFVNGKLAVDLGGLHQSATGSVNLDGLGLTVGKEYPLDLFNAERRPVASHFRADTNLAFTSCGAVPPDIPH